MALSARTREAATLALVVLVSAVLPSCRRGAERDLQQVAVKGIASIGASLERYARDNRGKYPWVASIEELDPSLIPAYSDGLPRLDPWGNRYYFLCWQEDQVFEGCDHFRIASAGKDGRLDHENLRDYQPGEIESEDGDIVFAGANGKEGAFVTRTKGSPR